MVQVGILWFNYVADIILKSLEI